VGGSSCANFSKKMIVVKDGFEVYLGGDRMICPGDSIILKPKIVIKNSYIPLSDLICKWEGIDKGTDSGSNSLKIKEEGYYKIVVSDNKGNSISDEIFVGLYPSPIVNLGENKTISKGELLTLYSNDIFAKYLWSTGEKESQIDVCDNGKYWLRVSDFNKCTGSDTVSVSYTTKNKRNILVAKLPTSFSPNGDGVNDILFIRGEVSKMKKLQFVIFRKDGLKLFESSDINVGWDGTYKGIKQKMDGYIYFFKIVFDNGESYIKKGSVNLIR